MSDVIVIGGGGHAKVVISALRSLGYSVGAVFDDEKARWGTNLLGVPIRGPISSASGAGCDLAVIAIGNNTVRMNIARSLNLRWLTLIHPAAWVAPSATLGSGTVVFAGAIIQAESLVGEHVIINTAATVDHECKLDDFAHIAPGVHLAGNVTIGKGAFLGISSTVIPGVSVGAWTTVGAGAVVVRDLPDGVIAYGVPAKPVRPSNRPSAPRRGFRILKTGQPGEWSEVLSRVSNYDFYHRPEYHALAEQSGGGLAHLFVYEENGVEIALPFLMRSTGDIPGLDHSGGQWCDATSAYGYLGPVASRPYPPEGMIRNFHGALRDLLVEMRVVSCFSRLHPLIEQRHLLTGLGECLPSGKTVSIDLTLPPAAQLAKYRENHLRDIRRAISVGAVCVEDVDFSHLGAFIEIYRETMERVDAKPFYMFDRHYFDTLISSLGRDIHLFVALKDGEVMGGGLFVECNGVLQYHLGGARDSFQRLAPIKLILDTVRIWGAERCLRVFHLGGGVGARTDSLFGFKAGFSDRQHEFSTWRWAVLPEVYRELCDQRLEWRRKRGLSLAPLDYFPLYRAAPCSTDFQPI